ncbi:MAG: glycosyltransferase A (GT-A) superfamily protein (DUF2064 family) [Chlamydiales bacterium]|jgi:glycosyltransferase A (GT-A) superfamily protein (DUF2064 family)
MTTAVAIFVKTPGLSPVKSRLAASIGKGKAEAFYLLSVQASEAVVLSAKALLNNRLHPYFAVAEKEAVNLPIWKNLTAMHSGEGGLGLRLDYVYSTLLKKHQSVLLIGADSPQITPDIIVQAHGMLKQSSSFIFGGAHDGGFYLFGGSKPVSKEIWSDVTYSSEKTLEQMVQNFSAIGEITYLKPLSDVDIESDINILEHEFSSPLLPPQKKLKEWCVTEIVGKLNY